jgi:hypothetical protein
VFKTARAKPSGRDVNCTRKQVTSSMREVGARAPNTKQNNKQGNKHICILYMYIEHKTKQSAIPTYTLLLFIKRTQLMMENLRSSMYNYLEYKDKLFLYLSNLNTRPPRRMGEWIDLRILDLSTSWKCVVSFASRPPYPRYPLTGWTQRTTQIKI